MRNFAHVLIQDVGDPVAAALDNTISLVDKIDSKVTSKLLHVDGEIINTTDRDSDKDSVVWRGNKRVQIAKPLSVASSFDNRRQQDK